MGGGALLLFFEHGNLELFNSNLFVAQLVKNPPAMWETWVPSLGWKDPLEKGKATHSSILAWRKESDTTEQLSLSVCWYIKKKNTNINLWAVTFENTLSFFWDGEDC